MLGNLNTNKSWNDTLTDIRDEFRRWDVEDYLLPIKSECLKAGKVSLTFAVHGQWCKPECARWQKGHTPHWLERNLRAIYLVIHAARLADQRGIGGLLAEVSKHLALPADPAIDPYAALGARPDASPEVLRHAYREAVKKHHPDVGGDPAAFRRVQQAAEELGL